MSKSKAIGVYGKVPPNAVDIEKVVLGACMLEKGAFDKVADILKPESFYSPAHETIYKAMTRLAATNMPIDELTVFQQLIKSGESKNIGGPFYLTELTKNVVSSSHIEEHARLIYEKWLARELITIGGELVTSGYDESNDVFDQVDSAEKLILSVTNKSSRSDFKHASDAVMEVIKRVDYVKTVTGALTGVSSGYPIIDAVTMGWQATDLIILAARPAVGKTAFALNLARNAIIHSETPVGIFSLEMSRAQLMERVISADSSVPLECMKRGWLDQNGYQKKFNDSTVRCSQMPLYIDDTAGLSIFDFRAKARRMVQKHGVKLIIVDYLQLMSDGNANRGKSRENEVSAVSRYLKLVAKELNVPVIALSQLSRDIEKRSRGHRLPRLSDLRESGAIEQDADMIMFLSTADEEDLRDNASLKGSGKLQIAKHRNGNLENFDMKFFGPVQLWVTSDKVDDFESSNPAIVSRQTELFAKREDGYKPVSNIFDEEIPI